MSIKLVSMQEDPSGREARLAKADKTERAFNQIYSRLPTAGWLTWESQWFDTRPTWGVVPLEVTFEVEWPTDLVMGRVVEGECRVIDDDEVEGSD